MELSEFSNIARESANSYYNYLQSSKLGRSIINVRSIHQISNNKFKLCLAKKIAYIDSVEIKINSGYCPFEIDESDIHIVEYNELSAYIIVVASNRLSKILSVVPVSNITLESYLTFLVKAVREWYYKHSEGISFPLPPFDERVPERPEHASDEQYKAICSALSSSISYIWGAPGTGKTQMVLANCILNYAEMGEQVLLMAPTNNALEHSLRGLISVLDEKKFDRRKIIRLGKATSDFLIKYPELCEIGYYDSLVDSLKQELDSLKDNYEKQKQFVTFSSINKAYRELIEKHNSALETKDEYSGQYYGLSKLLLPIQSEIAKIQENKNKCETTLGKLEQQLQDQNFYQILIKSYSEYRKIMDRYVSSIKKLSKELLKSKNELSDINAKIIRIQTELSEETRILNEHILRRDSLSFKFKSIFSRTLKNELEICISEQQSKTDNITALLQNEKTLRIQVQENIEIIEKNIAQENLIKSGTPELLEISQTVFGEHLTFHDLEEAFKNKLLEYKEFRIDKNIDDKINAARNELCTAVAALEAKACEAEQIEQNMREVYEAEAIVSSELQELRCRISKISFDFYGKDLSLEKLDELFEKQCEEYQDYIEIPNIEQLIENKEQEYQNIMVQLKDLLSERTIIACTVDYATIHYDKFAEGIAGKAAHLFVDEAAYCPLIKSGVFFSFGIPVTLLGDHMQLPPICEMNKQTILSSEDNQNILLWDISAIHFPDLFEETLTFEDILNGYIEDRSPYFNNVSVSFLKQTFRFGENLASIMDKFIYKQGFFGNDSEVTEIIVVDSPRNCSESAWNESRSEIESIRKYLNEIDTQDFAILTPYKKQRALIETELRLPAEKVLTIHSAQGREWDTVIISVVDAKRKFFMSSRNKKSNGLRVVNTAISRAKKELVLVMDCECWSNEKIELLSELAKNFTVNAT